MKVESLKAETLKADLFEQSVQMMRGESWPYSKTKALLHRCLYLEMKQGLNSTEATISKVKIGEYAHERN